MPVSLQDLLNETATVAVPVARGTLNVEYRAGMFNMELEDLLFGPVPDGERYGDRMVIAFLRLIVSWDMLGEDGKPLPLSEEVLRRIPQSIMHNILKAICNDMSPTSASRFQETPCPPSLN